MGMRVVHNAAERHGCLTSFGLENSTLVRISHSALYNSIFKIVHRHTSKIVKSALLVSSRLSVCLSAHPYGTTHLPLKKKLRKYDVYAFFEKSAQKIQVSLKSDKNSGYFT